jgi:hypothetical protein
VSGIVPGGGDEADKIRERLGLIEKYYILD